MSSRAAVAIVTLSAAVALGGCTDTATPDAQSTQTRSSAGTPASSTTPGTAPSTDNPPNDPIDDEEPNPQALLSAAQDALREADAVRVSSHVVVAQGTVNTVTNSHVVWSSSPPAWLSNTRGRAVSGDPRYAIAWRYRDGDLYQRLTLRDVRDVGWSRSTAKWLGVDPGDVPNYPVAVVLKATAVDAVPLTQATVIRAEVPNALADRWFGITRMLDSSGLPRALKGGTTQVSITVDDSGFPIKVAYRGDDMGLTADVPDYVHGNMAASELTAYYRPATFPPQLQSKPSTDN